jgi:hypothetical protein
LVDLTPINGGRAGLRPASAPDAAPGAHRSESDPFCHLVGPAKTHVAVFVTLAIKKLGWAVVYASVAVECRPTPEAPPAALDGMLASFDAALGAQHGVVAMGDDALAAIAQRQVRHAPELPVINLIWR